VAITSSSMRGGGNTGVVKAARTFLATVDLRTFGTADGRKFLASLDQTTNNLVAALPRASRHWGLARKGLNIFLRECLYTVYLRDRFGLGKAESWFEIPLDSFTGKALRVLNADLPTWKTVKGVDPLLNREFQDAARRQARDRKVARVHLDAVWWGKRPDAS
jgi:hypothetical protein